MSDKEFKTIDEQIQILLNRGLNIPDTKQASDFLLYNNYYRISGYSLTLRSHDVFHDNASLQNIIDIYTFDHKLRHILLSYIDIIEVSFKSVYAYEFTKRYGATGHLNAEYFTDTNKHSEIIKKAEKQQQARLQHEAYIKHFVVDLKQNIPLWAYVDLLTISDISFLYKISTEDIQKAVADTFGILLKGPDLLVKFMHSITILRNLCAHGVRLYNRLFEQKPSLNKKQRQMLNKDDNGIDNAHLFSYLLVMQRLLRKEDFVAMFEEISKLHSNYLFVNMRYYGFPENWNDLILSNK